MNSWICASSSAEESEEEAAPSSSSEQSEEESKDSDEEEEEEESSSESSDASESDQTSTTFITWKLTKKLKPAQKKALAKFSQTSGLLAAGLGVGKTLIGLHWLLERMEGTKLPGLVLAPKAVLHQFKEELQNSLSVSSSHIVIVRNRNHLATLIKWSPSEGRWTCSADKRSSIWIMTPALYCCLLTRKIDGFWVSKNKRLAAHPNAQQINRFSRQRGNVELGRLAGFLALSWRAVVVDEAHYARNPGTSLWSALNWICRQTTQGALLMTGTPIVNRREDLYSLAGLLDPYYGRSWKGWGNEDKEKIWSDKYLFHCKADVASVDREIREVVLNKQETREYRKYVELLGFLVNKFEHNRSGMMLQILSALQRVRQCLNHVDLASTTDVDQEEFVRFAKPSSKMSELLTCLKELPGKTAIFSQWLVFIQGFAEHLPKGSYLIYSGKMTANARKQVLDQLRDDPKIRYLLLTYGAGGVGLNLQKSVQNVILADPWWNSATEEQAIGRVNRFGQENPVRVIEMRSKTWNGLASVETWLAHIKQHKRTEASGFLKVGGVKLELADTDKFNLNQLAEFLSWSEQKGVVDKKASKSRKASDSKQASKRIKIEKVDQGPNYFCLI